MTTETKATAEQTQSAKSLMDRLRAIGEGKDQGKLVADYSRSK